MSPAQGISVMRQNIPPVSIVLRLFTPLKAENN